MKSNKGIKLAAGIDGRLIFIMPLLLSVLVASAQSLTCRVPAEDQDCKDVGSICFIRSDNDNCSGPQAGEVTSTSKVKTVKGASSGSAGVTYGERCTYFCLAINCNGDPEERKLTGAKDTVPDGVPCP
jgi:hypothetical protein